VRLLNRRFDSWAGRLSRHRRGPVAGLLLIVLGLLLYYVPLYLRKREGVNVGFVYKELPPE